MIVDTQQQYLTKEQLASKLQTSIATINRMISNGTIVPIRFGKRVLFPENIELKGRKQESKKEEASKNE